MFKPMTTERREQIRAALEPLPAYPWHWRRGRDLMSADVNPTILVTSGHGAAALQFVAHDPETDDMVRLTPRQLANRGLPNIVGNWIENSAQYAEELLFEVDRLSREVATAHAVRIPIDTLRPLIDPNRHTRNRAAAYLKSNGFEPTDAVDIWQRGTDLMLLPGFDIDWAATAPYFVRNVADALGVGELGVLAGIATA